MAGLNQVQFAKRLGVAKSYITKLKQQGKLVFDAEGLIDAEKTEALIAEHASPAAHHRANSERLTDERGGGDKAPRSSGQHGEIYELNLRLKRAEADKREHEAAMARMDRDAKARDLIRREDVDFVLADFGAALRSIMDGFADRLAPVLLPLETLEEMNAEIHVAAQSVLVEIQATMERRAKEFEA